MNNVKKPIHNVPQKSTDNHSKEITKRIECDYYSPTEMELYKYCKGYTTAEDHSHRTLW